MMEWCIREDDANISGFKKAYSPQMKVEVKKKRKKEKILEKRKCDEGVKIQCK